MSVWNQVTAIEDGWNVEASVINRPLSELAERTGYLKKTVDELGSGGIRSSVRFDVELSDPSSVWLGAVVCLDPVTGKYVLARSRMSEDDLFSASASCHSVGMLCGIDLASGKGTVVSEGLLDISGPGFDIDTMLETGETFRDGIYFLSSREDGKITAFPNGPRVQVGMVVGNRQASRPVGDRVVVSVQYGDLSSHVHRAYPIAAVPCGNPTTVTGPQGSPGRVYSDGYLPDAARSDMSGAIPSVLGGDSLPRLRLCGEWTRTGSRSVYVITLSGLAQGDSVPESFPAYLVWSSSDPEEGSGSARIGGFYDAVPIGTKGLLACVEPEPVHSSSAAPCVSVPYRADEDSAEKRTWTVDAPEYARGWSPNDVGLSAEIGDAGDTIVLHGVLDRNVGNISVMFPGKVFELVSSMGAVHDGDSITIFGPDGNEETFVFYSNETDPNTLPDDGASVAIPISGSVFDTLACMASAVGFDDGVAAAFDRDDGKVYVGASSVSVSRAEGGVSQLVPEKERSSGAVMMAAGGSGESLARGGWAEFPSELSPVVLKHGVFSYFTSLSDGGSVVLWKSSELVVHGCPGAAFMYNIGMDQALGSCYPPVPAGSGYVVMGGKIFSQGGSSPDFKAGVDTLYWMSDTEGETPWPSSYLDPEDAGNGDAGRPSASFHFVSSLAGEVGPVTSLRPSDGSPIKVARCGTGQDSTTGDLELDVDLTMDVLDGGERGYKAVKSGRGGRLLLGPVVERIVAGPGLQVSSLYGQPDGQGTVTVSMSNATYAGDAETVALENAKEEMVGMFPYIRMLGWDASSERNVETGFVARFHVPYGIPDVPYGVRLYATVFGEDSFSGGDGERMAGLRMTYSILPNWSPNGPQNASMNVRSDVISPDDEKTVEIPFGYLSGGSYSYKAFDPVVVHNDTSLQDVEGRCRRTLGESSLPVASECSGYLELHPGMRSSFGVRPGYIVSVRFSRSAPREGLEPYTGRIGFTGLRWSLVDLRSEDGAAYSAPMDCDTVIGRLQRVASEVRDRDVVTSEAVKRVLLSIVDQLR